MQTTRYPFESTLSEARELNRPCIKLIVKRAKHYKYRLSIDMIESFQEEKHLDRDASLELVATLMTGSSLPHGRVGRWDTVVEPRSSFHLVSYETLDDAIRIGQSVFDVLTNAKCDGGAYYRSRLRGDADLQEMVDVKYPTLIASNTARASLINRDSLREGRLAPASLWSDIAS